jgi:hypothetical protein
MKWGRKAALPQKPDPPDKGLKLQQCAIRDMRGLEPLNAPPQSMQKLRRWSALFNALCGRTHAYLHSSGIPICSMWGLHKPRRESQ